MWKWNAFSSIGVGQRNLIYVLLNMWPAHTCVCSAEDKNAANELKPEGVALRQSFLYRVLFELEHTKFSNHSGTPVKSRKCAVHSTLVTMQRGRKQVCVQTTRFLTTLMRPEAATLPAVARPSAALTLVPPLAAFGCRGYGWGAGCRRWTSRVCQFCTAATAALRRSCRCGVLGNVETPAAAANTG